MAILSPYERVPASHLRRRYRREDHLILCNHKRARARRGIRAVNHGRHGKRRDGRRLVRVDQPECDAKHVTSKHLLNSLQIHGQRNAYA
jgi:hypothetical protein